jgi:hypothetical protein
MRAMPAAQNPILRAARNRTRRRLHEPRPAATPEIKARIGQWKAEVKAACLAGYISKGGDKYLLELLMIPSVARGDYGLYCDTEMGERINVKGRTIRRHRKDAEIHGLVEVLGHGKDRKPCMVRPILRDGTPVFGGAKLAGKSDTFGRLTRPVVAAELLLTDILETEEPPPLAPSPGPDDTTRGGEALDQIEDQPAANPQPVELAKPIEPVEPAMTFVAFWQAMGRSGSEGYARSEWRKLSAADKAAIRDRLSRPHSWAAGMYAGNWLRDRVWEESVLPVSTSRPERVWLHERSPEWRCWQRHLVATRGRGTPMDSRGGWHFPSKLPPEGA